MPTRRAVLAALLFAFAYTQPFELYSNQHQYFLHGLAHAGVGHLADDWLARTADPTPLLSYLLQVSWENAGLLPVHVTQFLAIVVYYLAIRSIVSAIRHLPETAWGEWLFAAIFTLTHAGITRYASDRLLGADYAWFLQCGLANQYLLGPGLQPSVIGVLLLVSIAQYAIGRVNLAMITAAGTTFIHATYVLPAGLLILGFTLAECWKGNGRRIFCGVVLSFLLLLAVVAYYYVNFGPTSADVFQQAQSILANIRIPHHARPGRWFDAAAGFQCSWIILALFMLKRTGLGLPLLIAATLAAMGTLVVVLTDNATLALSFPWRISAALVPLSTALIAAWLVRRIERFPTCTAALSLPLFTIACLGAAAIYQYRLGYREPESEEAVLKAIRESARPGDCYLIPARFPKPNPPRGVYSNTFIAPPGPEAIVYFELARFRLATGAPVFVDFKSIPYKDVEVLEWHRRVERCVTWFGQSRWTDEMIQDLRREGITHVVAPAVNELQSPRLTVIMTAGAYRVYRVTP